MANQNQARSGQFPGQCTETKTVNGRSVILLNVNNQPKFVTCWTFGVQDLNRKISVFVIDDKRINLFSVNMSNSGHGLSPGKVGQGL